MCHCYPSGENKSFLIPTEGKNISFSPNKRKSERSERVSLWWKWNIFWLREGLKCFYLSCEGNTGILLLTMDSWQFFGKLEVNFLILICQPTFPVKFVKCVKFTIAKECFSFSLEINYARVRIKTFDWIGSVTVNSKRVNRQKILRTVKIQ